MTRTSNCRNSSKESCRVVRGAEGSCGEYLFELRTERLISVQ